MADQDIAARPPRRRRVWNKTKAFFGSCAEVFFKEIPDFLGDVVEDIFRGWE